MIYNNQGGSHVTLFQDDLLYFDYLIIVGVDNFTVFLSHVLVIAFAWWLWLIALSCSETSVTNKDEKI